MGTPLRLKACCTRWRTVLSKLACCAAVGWPPKKWAIWLLSYHGWALPVVIVLSSGYGPAPRLMKPSTGAIGSASAACATIPRITTPSAWIFTLAIANLLFGEGDHPHD